MKKLLSGRRGLVMGVANDHSIAWGIAKILAEHGAELAFTYQGEALGKRVAPLAKSVGSELVLPCDVRGSRIRRCRLRGARWKPGAGSTSSSTRSPSRTRTS
ncbi:SDR family oxidoreductase [Micromonospora sp. STR1s_5]|nr:SDR family oxidoreductase [Micromonospora sp. STR1s_5]